MKKIVITSIIGCMFLFSCKSKNSYASKNERAADSVKSYLAKRLNDPASYQPVRFDSLVTVMTTYKSDEHYYEYNRQAEDISLITADDMIKDFKLYERRNANGYYKKLKERGIKGVDSIKKVFKPRFAGYKIIHEYRAKNGFGALTIHTSQFKLDTNLSVWDSKEYN
jgi:hypothetical protein